MERRNAIQYLAAMTGGLLLSTELFLTGCKSNNELDGSKKGQTYSPSDIKLFDAIANIILPPMEGLPGPIDVATGTFIAKMVNDCYEVKKQEAFVKGLALFQTRCKESNKMNFNELDHNAATSYISALDTKAFEKEIKEKGDEVTFYLIVKELTLLSYFTSEACLTKDIEYIRVPTKYEGSLKIAPDQKIQSFGLGA